MKTTTRLMIAAAIFGSGLTVMSASAVPQVAEATEVKQGGDATGVLEAARKAASQLKAVSYNATMNGALNNVSSAAQVTLVRADAGGWKIWSKGENRANPMTHAGKGEEKSNIDNATPIAFEVSYDGATGHSVSETAKTVYQSSIKDELTLRNFFASQRATWTVPWDMTGENPFTFSGNSVATLHGTTDVGGVTCNVVKVSSKSQATKGSVVAHGGSVVTYYFGVQDNIVRRVDRAIGADGDNGRNTEMTQSSVTFTDMKFDSAANGASFTPAIPDGFVILPVAGKKDNTNAGADKNAASHGNGLITVGSDAPDWTLSTPTGEKVTLSSLKGKVVVMDFWATWCGPCKAAMPNVQKLSEEFAGKDVVIYGLSTWEKGGDPAAFMKQNKFNYGLLVHADEVSRNYKVSGIPTFYVIGKDGKVLYNAVGFDEGDFGKIKSVINGGLKAN